MQTYINNATSTFQTTFGFSFSDVIDWVVLKMHLILGTGLGIVDAILPYVVGVIAIGVLVGLLYLVLKFLHIIR